MKQYASNTSYGGCRGTCAKPNCCLRTYRYYDLFNTTTYLPNKAKANEQQERERERERERETTAIYFTIA